MMIKKLTLLILFFLFVPHLSYAFITLSPPLPKNDIAAGPSIAYIRDSNNEVSGHSINFDTSITYEYFAASINGKYLEVENCQLYGFQTEFTAWIFFINLGGGIGYLWGDKPGTVYHIFVGCPIPSTLISETFFSRYLFFEPYYRRNFTEKGIYNEFGLMCKMTTYRF